MQLRHFYFHLLALACALGVVCGSGCRMSPVPAPQPASATPPDFARITRIAPADLAVTPNTWGAALARDFSGMASAPLAPLSNSATSTDTQNTTATRMQAALGELTARAAARRAALRALAIAILATTDSANRTLRSQLATQPQLFNTLGATLESQARTSFDATTSAVTARAQLPGAPLATALKLDALTPQPNPEELEAARQRARDAALEQAKAALREQLLATKLDDGQTYAQRFAGDQSALNEIDALVFLLQPDEIHYTPDNSARVTVFFDRNQVRTIARNHAKRGFFSRLFHRN